jgi:CRP-like cAMP-binding protein
MSAEEYGAIVATIAPFSRLDGDEVGVVCDVAVLKRYAPGEWIARAGRVASRVSIVVEGSVEGAPGRVFGMLGLLTGTPGLLDLKAGPEGAACLHVRRGPFFTIVHECPEILTWILEQEPTAVLEGMLS